jgi:hypothetical protein
MISVLYTESPKLRVQHVRYQSLDHPHPCRRSLYHGRHHLRFGQMATEGLSCLDNPSLGVAVFDRTGRFAR